VGEKNVQKPRGGSPDPLSFKEEERKKKKSSSLGGDRGKEYGTRLGHIPLGKRGKCFKVWRQKKKRKKKKKREPSSGECCHPQGVGKKMVDGVTVPRGRTPGEGDQGMKGGDMDLVDYITRRRKRILRALGAGPQVGVEGGRTGQIKRLSRTASGGGEKKSSSSFG